LLLALLAVLVALVACGGEKNPNGDQPKVTTKAPTTKAPTYTVKFMDSELFLENGEQVELSAKEIKRGDFARAPRDPYHEGYVFLGWDVDDYSYITSDMTITAMYRPVDTYKVEFYDGETFLGAVTVAEGEEAVAPATPLKVGYVFSAWDKPVARVDREWEDFAAYADLSLEELAETEMVFKTTATYIEADGVIEYYDDIKFELKETTVDGKKVWVPANAEYFADTIPYIELDAKHNDGLNLDRIPEEEKYNMVDTDIALAWDGDYLYMYVTLEDPTLMSRGRDYCFAEAVPWQNDSFEVWYTFHDMPYREILKLFMLDFYGYRLTSDGEGGSEGVIEMSKHFENIQYITKVVENTNTSYMFFKIPAIDEEDVKLVAGDVFYYAIQIDDLRSYENNEGILRSGTSNRYAYNEYEKLTFGAKK
jgi:hypothetical protein